MSAIGASDSTSPVTPPSSAAPHSIWLSPVAYLFGGMAAVSLLISAALLLLILSYWQYKNRLIRAEDEMRVRDLEAGGEERSVRRRSGEGSRKATYRERFAVIMAGDERPRFLASPRCYRGFGVEEDEEEMKQNALGKMKRSSEATSLGSETASRFEGVVQRSESGTGSGVN